MHISFLEGFGLTKMPVQNIILIGKKGRFGPARGVEFGLRPVKNLNKGLIRGESMPCIPKRFRHFAAAFDSAIARNTSFFSERQLNKIWTKPSRDCFPSFAAWSTDHSNMKIVILKSAFVQPMNKLLIPARKAKHLFLVTAGYHHRPGRLWQPRHSNGLDI